MFFTQNPIGSSATEDLQDNAISFDYAMNSPAALWQDRFGKQHKTVQQALKDVGFKPAGFDFVSGGTLGIGDRDKCVFYPTDGYWHSWNGKLPYVVPANSSPTPGGKKGWKPVVIRNPMTQYSSISALRTALDVAKETIVETANYYETSIVKTGGGSARYLITSLENARVIRQDPTWVPDNFGDHTLTLSDTVALIITDRTVDFKQFGAKDGDLTYDSSNQIQACIDFCAPFKWLGSVGNTCNSSFTRARIESHGVYRIDKHILLNPYTDIRGSGSVGYFSNLKVGTEGRDVGLVFITKFSNKDQYALDTAPYTTDGIRNSSWDRTFTNQEFDAGAFTAVAGIKLESIAIIDPDKTGIFGGLRMAGGIGFTLSNVKLVNFKTPYFENVCWGHTYQRMHLNGFWCGFASVNGTIGTDLGGMYNDGADYEGTNNNPYPVDRNKLPSWWILADEENIPSDCAYLSTGIYARGGSGFPLTSFQSPIIQGYERAVAANAATIILNQPYIESIKRFAITGYWSTVIINEPFLYSTNNIPFWYMAGSGKYVLNNPINSLHGPMRLNHKVPVNKYAEFDLAGIPATMLNGSFFSTYRDGKLPLYNFTGAGDVNNTLTQVSYYVSSSGVDSNFGFTPSNSLKTIDEALSRVQKGQQATIYLKAGEVHLISNYSKNLSHCSAKLVSDGSTSLSPTIRGNVDQDNNVPPIQLTSSNLICENIWFEIAAPVVVDYWDTLFRASGVCSITFINCGFTIPSDFCILRATFNSLLNITTLFDNCTINGTGKVTKDNKDPNSGRILLTIASRKSTATVSGIGTQTTKLFDDLTT